MSGDQNERHCQPDPSSLHAYGKGRFGDHQTYDEKLERFAQNPMRFMQLAEIFDIDRCVHGNSIQQLRNTPLRRSADASEDPLKYAIQVFDVTSGKQILTKKPG